MIGVMAKHRNEDRHKGEPVQVRMPADMKDALVEYARSQRRSTTQTAFLLLEEIMEQKGIYPRKPQEE